jgi:hypothetical protein
VGARVDAVRQFFAEIPSAGRERFAGLFDFSYQHYALGDALTAQAIIGCLAHEAECAEIDLYLFVDPVYPAAPGQGFINRYNYPVYLDNLFPAFLCLPGLSSIRLVRDTVTAGLIQCSLAASRTQMWPSLNRHLRRRVAYPMSHDIINRFYEREGLLSASILARVVLMQSRQPRTAIHRSTNGMHSLMPSPTVTRQFTS